MTDAPRAELWKGVAAERHIAAPAAHVYRLIADFNEHHAKFLPPAFRDLRVERGGVGAGTVITFDLVNGTSVRHCRSEVSEPEPGRALVEEDRGNGTRTTFRVTPDGAGCLARIESQFRVSPGFRGIVERIIAPPVLSRLLAEELARLDDYARSIPS